MQWHSAPRGNYATHNNGVEINVVLVVGNEHLSILDKVVEAEHAPVDFQEGVLSDFVNDNSRRSWIDDTIPDSRQNLLRLFLVH